MQYRKEVDGLRALAVLAVIVYHADMTLLGFPLFQGGFFGVDVFFVLSGFLITSIIRDQMENNNFSLIDFYWRRAKRIVPALLVVLAITSLAAYNILLPNDLEKYSQSLQSALYFGSNYFWLNEDSYIADASIYKPLLHTWSLAVEWQFYIIFPIIVWTINKFFKKYLFSCLLALSLFSLLYAQFIVSKNPDSAFYLLPSRGWELILGGLTSFYDRNRLNNTTQSSLKEIIYKYLPTLGILMIALSMLFISHNVLHPSMITLLPVLGTCLFIMFTRKNELTNTFFSIKPVVFIGTISYSLYLWHQPIFVFFRLTNHDNINIINFFVLTLISFSLAFITYIFIEKTFRKKTVLGLNYAWLLVILGGSIWFSNLSINTRGLPQRLGVIAHIFDNLGSNSSFKVNGQQCHNSGLKNACEIKNSGDRNIVLIGDSHAGTLGQGLYNLSKEKKWGFKQLTNNGCTGFNNVIRKSGEDGIIDKRCLYQSKLISQYIENEKTPNLTIVFLARLPLLLNGTRFDNTIGGKESGLPGWIEPTDAPSASQSIEKKLSLWASLGHEIILIYPVPEVGWDVPKLVQRELAKHIFLSTKLEAYKKMVISTPYNVYQERTKSSFMTLNNVHGDRIIRIYPHEIFCQSSKCIANDSDNLYYRDDDHPSNYGAQLIINRIAQKLQ